MSIQSLVILIEIYFRADDELVPKRVGTIWISPKLTLMGFYHVRKNLNAHLPCLQPRLIHSQKII